MANPSDWPCQTPSACDLDTPLKQTTRSSTPPVSQTIIRCFSCGKEYMQTETEGVTSEWADLSA